jgi:hypothetical protein
MMKQGVGEGTPGVPRAGMHDHAGGLVHHHQEVILVYDRQGYGLGNQFSRRRIGSNQADPFSSPNSVAGLQEGAVDRDAASLDPLLDGGARRVAQPARQNQVQTRLFVCGVDDID